VPHDRDRRVKPGDEEAEMERWMELKEEAEKLTNLLRGKSVKLVRRHRAKEVVIEFDDGTRLFVDTATALDFSVTDMREDEE
jgi:hypothetical protein